MRVHGDGRGSMKLNSVGCAAGQAYVGSVLCSADGNPPPSSCQPQVQAALERAGVKEWELFWVNSPLDHIERHVQFSEVHFPFTNCINAVQGSGTVVSTPISSL